MLYYRPACIVTGGVISLNDYMKLKIALGVAAVLLLSAVVWAVIPHRGGSTEEQVAARGTTIPVLSDKLATSTTYVPPVPTLATSTSVSGGLSMIFVGDIMLDRNVYNAVKRNGGNYEHPFLLIGPELAKYDLSIANLEGPITDTSFNMKRAQAMSFTFDPKFVAPLAKHFDVVSLANNHTHNFLEKGLQSTKKYLNDDGVQYFGDPLNRTGLVGRIVEKNGFKIALVGYHAFGAPESVGIPVVEKAIRELKTQADVVIVMPHWGAEYKPKPISSQVVAAHRFIDAGADMIIGGHPHVVESTEVYKGYMIYYSLGNFIFDQYFSKETMEGIMVDVTLVREDDGSVSYKSKAIPYKINKESQPYIAQ